MSTEAAAQALERVPGREDLHVLATRLRLGQVTPAMVLRSLRAEQEPGPELRGAIAALEQAATMNRRTSQ